MIRADTPCMRVSSCKVIAIVAALVVVGAAPSAHAYWGHGPGPLGHQLDLGVRVGGEWVGFDLSDRSTDPSAFVVERPADGEVTTIVRLEKFGARTDSATIRGCDLVQYLVDGIDVSKQVRDGGYTLKGLEAGHTNIHVIAHFKWSYECRIKVTADGRVHDALTLRFSR